MRTLFTVDPFAPLGDRMVAILLVTLPWFDNVQSTRSLCSRTHYILSHCKYDCVFVPPSSLAFTLLYILIPAQNEIVVLPSYTERDPPDVTMPRLHPGVEDRACIRSGSQMMLKRWYLGGKVVAVIYNACAQDTYICKKSLHIH